MTKLELVVSDVSIVKRHEKQWQHEVVLHDCTVDSLAAAIDSWIYKKSLFALLKDEIFNWVIYTPSVYAECLGELSLDEAETFSLNKDKILDWITSDPALIKEFKEKLNEV